MNNIAPFTHSEKAFTLDNSISLYVPTVYRDHSPIPTNEVEGVKSFLIDELTSLFGGCTVTIGVGYFKHESGRVQAENVYILNSFADSVSLSLQQEQLKNHATWTAKALKQEAVLLVVNGQAGFYEAE